MPVTSNPASTNASVKGPAPQPTSITSSDLCARISKATHNLVCCAACKGSECSCPNIREIALVKLHTIDLSYSTGDLQFLRDNGACPIRTAFKLCPSGRRFAK
jgi:hypothetical protein